tara:strand:+ start:74 stop:496 length:423 start_codon:yes stop_codon:yes gene_type:complete
MTVIFQDRGKQYKAKVGDFIKLPKMSTVKKNDTIVLNDIIFYKDDKGESLIGSPKIENIVLKAKVVEQIRDKKIIVFKKKRRHNYRRKIGHRQDLTLIKIEEIQQKNTSVNPQKPSVKKDNDPMNIKKEPEKSKGESNGT